MANIASEFQHACSNCAMTIVNELMLEDEDKTIKIVSSTIADGRAIEGGRGLKGLRHKFEAWGIRFKVMLDDHGIFNGSDENAAKAASAERRNALECG